MARRCYTNSILINSKFKIIMNKKYIVPALQVEEAQAAQMLAESLAINSGTTVSGNDALTKEEAWDIWEAE
jgi:hypothetical protein